jgi:lipopolysaccharide transport system ATP-binding protein
MGDIAIKIENLSKQYRLGVVGTGTLSHDLKRWWTVNVRRQEDPYLKIGETNDRASKGMSDYVWALKDINLEIKQGDVVGIIGKNGAGKSTLLKILSKVTKPTTGSIDYKGRIASLLEVGTGFHPEMTGRENIYMNGAIMGMNRAEITRKFDEIVAFAGVERYIDTPVKRYSSGMTVRLGFSIAAHLEPDILVVDEVLAVGDAEFQKKAIGKMQDVSKEGGRTVLFVSHNMTAVKALCNKGVLLSNGTVKCTGQMDSVIDDYILGYQKNFDLKRTWLENHPKGEHIKLLEAEIISENNLMISQEVKISFTFELEVDMQQFNGSLVLYTVENEPIFNSWSELCVLKKGVHKAVMKIPENFLNTKIYKIRILFVNHSKALIDIHDILHFEANEDGAREVGWFGDVIGEIRPKLEWLMQ